MDCGYILNGTSTHQCPECGKSFSPRDPLSFASVRRHWYKKWLDELIHAILRIIGMILAIICIVTTLLMFYALCRGAFGQTIALLLIGCFYGVIARVCLEAAESKESYTVY